MPVSKPRIKRRKAKKAKKAKIQHEAEIKKQKNLELSDDELKSFLLGPLEEEAYDSAALLKQTAIKQFAAEYAEKLWVKPNQSVTIHGRKLKQGFIYVGEDIRGLDDDDYIEPALINPSLPAAKTRLTTQSKKNSLSDYQYSYFSQFLHIVYNYTALCEITRGEYLDWLASGRCDPDISLSYILLYFSGIERRIISDMDCNIPDSEFIAILNEVIRLKNIYGRYPRFHDSVNSFIQLMLIKQPELMTEKYMSSLSVNRWSFQFMLAQTVAEGRSVGAELAFFWLIFDSDDDFLDPVSDCKQLFHDLFCLQYDKQLPAGMMIKPNKERLQFTYQPVNRCIHDIKICIKGLPDPSMLEKPLDKILKVAEVCMQELTAYDSYYNKYGSSEDDLEALILLPNLLMNDQRFGSPVFSQFTKWANKVISKQQGLTTVKDFWKHLQKKLPDIVHKKHQMLMQQFAQKCGFGIAPDVVLHQERIKKADEYVALFKLPDECDSFDLTTNTTQWINLSLRLGAMIATANGQINEKRYMIMKNLIDHSDILTSVEKNASHAYLTWSLNTPANMLGMKTQLNEMDADEKQLIRQFIISVALAGGKTNVSEIKLVEKAYTALGLDKSQVPGDMHGFSSTKPFVTKKTAKPGGKQRKNTINSGFELDAETLALHKQETHAVQKVLGNIFTEDTTETEEIPTAVAEVITGLDDAHQKLYEQLITKEKWAREDVMALCDKLRLMPDGAIETINDWSFESVDAALIDDDGDFCIDFEVAEELRG